MKEHWSKTVLRHTRHCRGKMIASVLFAIIGVLGGLVPYYGIYNLVIILTGDAPVFGDVLPWVLVCLAGYVIKLVFHALSTALSHISAYTILNNLRLKICEKLMDAPLGVVINEKVGRIKNAVIDRVEVIELPIAHMIPEGLSNILISVSVFVYLISVDYRMALAAMIPVPIALAIGLITLSNYTAKYQNAMKISDNVNSVIVEYAEGIKEIKMFNQTDTSYEKFEKAVNGFKNHMLDWGKSVMAPLGLMMALLPTTLLGIVPVGIILSQTGALTPAEFVLCVALGIGIAPPLMNLSVFVNDIKMIQYAVDDTSEFLNVEQLHNSETDVVIKNHSIEFKDVSFSYNGEAQVLKNINLKMDQDTFCALVGPSGSGKSTMARLIARFWDVSSGDITIGGTSLRNIPLKQLAQTISFVTQDNFLFDCSLLENIRMGNPKASDEAVIQAAKKARCHDFISALENGYNTTAGEAGNRLSGGEKQRISIARAILKNAPIVIFDEATTYTDPENEWEIQKSISALAKGKTLVVIAHRLSTITHADKIILIDKGEIKAMNSHERLLEESEVYHSMWQAHIDSKSWTPKRGEAYV